MPIPRADLALRREVLVLFELCGVDPSSVVFADELDLSALQAEGRLRLTLMDHNAVSGCLSALGDAVVEIVDHHKDLEKHPGVEGTARDIAFDAGDGSGRALVGSCCTLVAERMLAQEQKGAKLLSSDVARLLLGVVRKNGRQRERERERERGCCSKWWRRVGVGLEVSHQSFAFDSMVVLAKPSHPLLSSSKPPAPRSLARFSSTR